MFVAELILTSSLSPRFHAGIEQITGLNPGNTVQRGKRPKSDSALPLAYIKALIDPNGDTSDVRALLGFLHFGIMCIGAEYDLAEVTGWPHGLRCLYTPLGTRKFSGVIFSGDGEQWASALEQAATGPEAVVEWGLTCARQFKTHNLDELFNQRTNRKIQYFLEN